MADEKGYAPPRYGGDVFGDWQPNTLTDLLECAQDPYITPAGVVPEWVLSLRAAAAECRAGHPAGLTGRQFCGTWGCHGVRTPPAEQPGRGDRS